MSVLKKLNRNLPASLYHPFLCVYTREMKAYVPTKTYMRMFAAALFMIASISKETKMSINPGMNKQIVVHAHDGILFGNKKGWIVDPKKQYPRITE